MKAEVRATGTSFRKLDNVVKTKTDERKYLKGEVPSPATLVHDKKNQASKTANEQLRSLKATRNDCFLAVARLRIVSKLPRKRSTGSSR